MDKSWPSYTPPDKNNTTNPTNSMIPSVSQLQPSSRVKSKNNKLNAFLNMDLDKMNIIPYKPKPMAMSSPPQQYNTQNGQNKQNGQNIQNKQNGQNGQNTQNVQNKQHLQNGQNKQNKDTVPNIPPTTPQNPQVTPIYYICGIDPNLNYLVAGFLSKIGTCYSIHQRMPPVNITQVRGRHFTNIIDTSTGPKYMIFLYNNPILTLSSSNIWTVSHCSDLMYPKSTDTLFNKFMEGEPNIISYLEGTDDWLEIADFYKNYLNSETERNYGLVTINTDKLWDSLDDFSEALKIPKPLMKHFPKRPDLKIPNIETSLFKELNNYIENLPTVQVIGQNSISGKFVAKLNKKNQLKFKINTKFGLNEKLILDIVINDQIVSQSNYSYSYELLEGNTLQVIIKSSESENNREEINVGYNLKI